MKTATGKKEYSNSGKASDYLKAARAKIEKKESWTKDVFAKNADGQEVAPRDSKAVCFCSMGAIKNATPFHLMGTYTRAVKWLMTAIETPRIAVWNDNSTHAEVLAGFDRAIEMAMKAGD